VGISTRYTGEGADVTQQQEAVLLFGDSSNSLRRVASGTAETARPWQWRGNTKQNSSNNAVTATADSVHSLVFPEKPPGKLARATGLERAASCVTGRGSYFKVIEGR